MQMRDDAVETLIRKASATYRQAASASRSEIISSSSRNSKRFSPATWTVDSNIQLVAPKQSDTSDRSLFERARLATFDRDGYAHDKGLRRPLYYTSGFLTCSTCNGLSFIDASALRSLLELKAYGYFEGVRPESLRPCAGCGETSGLRVGAHDFLGLIEGGKEALERRRQLKQDGALKLQRAFRRYLKIQWRLAEATRQRTIFLLRYRSTQVIQAMLRGRLGRRAFETEKFLLIIKKVNSSAIDHAVNNYPGRKKVFWYESKAEEQLLYDDYRFLVQRTGFNPSRMAVEQNIREIAQRILERQGELASRIQARWRGTSDRRYLIVFRREIQRQRQVRAIMTFRIQRAVRGWFHRRLAVKCRSQRAGRELMDKYRCEKDARGAKDARRGGAKRLLQAYARERQEEFTARLMGYTEPKLTGGLRMKAFYESPYGNQVVANLMNHEAREILRRENEAREKDLARKRRAEWVRLKILQEPVLATYFRDQVNARNAYLINRLRSGRRATNKVSAILRHHNQVGGCKYSFPLNVNHDPMAVLSERCSTDSQALLRRFSKPSPDTNK